MNNKIKCVLLKIPGIHNSLCRNLHELFFCNGSSTTSPIRSHRINFNYLQCAIIGYWFLIIAYRRIKNDGTDLLQSVPPVQVSISSPTNAYIIIELLVIINLQYLLLFESSRRSYRLLNCIYLNLIHILAFVPSNLQEP